MTYTIHPNETVVLEVRRHLFVFYASLSWLFIFLLVPLLAYGFIYNFFSDISGGHPVALFISIYSLWLLILWLIGFYLWTDYYMDVWVITDRRIVDIEQNGFFHREVTNFSIDRIEDITVNINGIVPTMLKFGDLHVHTAADGHEFVIRQANDPLHIKEVIVHLTRKEKEELGQQTVK